MWKITKDYYNYLISAINYLSKRDQLRHLKLLKHSLIRNLWMKTLETIGPMHALKAGLVYKWLVFMILVVTWPYIEMYHPVLVFWSIIYPLRVCWKGNLKGEAILGLFPLFQIGSDKRQKIVLALSFTPILSVYCLQLSSLLTIYIQGCDRFRENCHLMDFVMQTFT